MAHFIFSGFQVSFARSHSPVPPLVWWLQSSTLWGLFRSETSTVVSTLRGSSELPASIPDRTRQTTNNLVHPRMTRSMSFLSLTTKIRDYTHIDLSFADVAERVYSFMVSSAFCASSSPCSAAIRIHFVASARFRVTPWPL